MITDSFEKHGETIISPGDFYGERKHFTKVAISTFSREIFANVLERYPVRSVGQINAANKIKQIYLLDTGFGEVAFYLNEIGAALAGTDVIEINWLTGAENFIMFGSAGALDKDFTLGKYVIPTEAYRDEGMSYHYAPPADYIDIPGAALVEQVMSENGLSFVKGRVWTTDALYRETREMVRRRKEEGCIAVEMELAGVQAVCDFHGFKLYDFLVTGDVVDQPEYTPEGLREANHSMDKFDVALLIARKLLV